MQLACAPRGTIEHERSLGRVHLIEARHDPNTVLDRHAHERPTLTLVTAGCFSEVSGGRAFECPAGTLFFRPAFTPHRNRFGIAGARSVIIELQWGDGPLWRLPHEPLRIESREATRVARHLSRLLDGHSPHRGGIAAAREAQKEALDLAALSFAEAGHSADPGHPSWLGHVYERLADWPRMVPSIIDLAREVGVHEDHLIRAFRDAYGETPGVLARRRRARIAGQMVRDGNEDLAAIAWAVGYADQSHMTREFTRFLGTTPGALRRSGLSTA